MIAKHFGLCITKGFFGVVVFLGHLHKPTRSLLIGTGVFSAFSFRS